LKVSVLIISYKRARYLRNALDSLCRQTVQPDEVIVVLKPSNDGSEDVVNEFTLKLNLNLLIQQGVGPINAYSQGIKNASGDILLFLDDDAIAEADWISKYIHLFNENAKIGGITGLCLKAEVEDKSIVLKEEPFYKEAYVEGFHRRPLEVLNGYGEYLSTSGLCGVSKFLDSDQDIMKSVLFGGLNMGFRSFLIKSIPLEVLYRGSRRAFWFEQHLALNVVIRGYDAVKVRRRAITPVVYHTTQINSLTRSKGFSHEFWVSYDRAINFWRIKMYGLKCSFPKYILGQIIISRKRFLPRFTAFLYTLFLGFYYYLRYKDEVRASLS